MSFKKNFFSELGSQAGKSTGSGIARIIGDFYGWIKFKPATEKESWVKVNTFRLGFISTVVVMISTAQCAFKQPVPTQEVREGVLVTVAGNLTIGIPPVMPEDVRFISTRDKNIDYYFFIGSQKYIMHRVLQDGGTPQIGLATKEPICYLIPKKEKALLITTYPPRYVLNMENKASVGVKVKNLPFLAHMFNIFKHGEEVIQYNASWQWVRDNWAKVDTKESGLGVRANDNHPGGLVCF